MSSLVLKPACAVVDCAPLTVSGMSFEFNGDASLLVSVMVSSQISQINNENRYSPTISFAVSGSVSFCEFEERAAYNTHLLRL